MPRPPRKKKSSQNRRKIISDANRLRRQNETGEERIMRLENDRIHREAIRAREKEEEREKRLTQKRSATAVARARETYEERERRLTQDRSATAVARARETDEERERRLTQDRSAVARARETDEEREKRLTQKRSATAVARTRETDEERERRLTQDRSATAVARAGEPDEEREKRLTQNRSATTAARARETDEERERRLTQNRSATAAARARETDEERERRLTQNRSATTIARELESSSTHESRLARARNLVTASRQCIWRQKENAAFAYDPRTDYSTDPSCLIGGMNVTCQFCAARKWKGESLGMCCSAGKVYLPPLSGPPELLRNLLAGDSEDAKHFQKNIRRYNSCFQMTSFGSTREIREPGYMPTFQGQVYHRIGSLHPMPNELPKYLQIYFIEDESQQANQRCINVPHTRQNLVLQLQGMLHEENNYVRSFKMTIEKITPEMKLIILPDKFPTGENARRFNAPTSSEVGLIMSGKTHGNRDIVLEFRSNNVTKIADTHRSYDTLQYPLIFWKGEDGYHFELRHTSPTTREVTNKKVSAMQFYAYRIMVRLSSFNIIVRGKALFQQFIVDMYAKIESERLRYIQINQKKLRSEEYIHLRDAVLNDGNVADIGKLLILPSSFTGGPRYMQERTQDAMTYVRNYGKPDLFITFTCNPMWEEIQTELFPEQKAHDRHDLLARVFHLKLKMLINIITKGKILGNVQCYMYSVEWQKRGLPHTHILVWFTEPIRANRIDDFISAEIPNPQEDPLLFNCVTTQMVHGPCGLLNPKLPCMMNRKCTKRFPRQFLKETQTGQDGYPLYRRRSPEDGGYTANIRVRRCEVSIDNRWIVPYCPLLSKLFNAHINVKFCNSVKSIKYVCKYINKGSDMAVFHLTALENDINEIHNYQMGRYISSNEAVWRILEFPIHGRHPAVIHLSVHLENGQRVYFTPENAVEQVQSPRDTTLTAFFRLCGHDEFARTLLYHQLPKYYTWDNTRRRWNRRLTGTNVPDNPGIKSTNTLGRVYTVHPSNFECFHLRLLLHEVKGPISFQDLRTVDGRICETYKEACYIRGLIENDHHWNATLEEAALTRSPGIIRNLFAVMLHICAVSSPQQLWFNHKDSMSEDILHQARLQQHNMDLDYNDTIYNSVLTIIEDKVKSLGGSDLSAFGLPKPVRNDGSMKKTGLFQQLAYDMEDLSHYLEENEPKMVQDQKAAFQMITNAVFNDEGGIFFLDAPGGTGKTFLINLILAKVRQKNFIAMAVASSGIAATLLKGGMTAHSAFKLPLNLQMTEAPTCNISRNSAKAEILQKCKLIVWDECTMSHKAAFETLDITLQDIRRDNGRMGGITLVLSGDFRQTLPVIPRGTRADEMNACVKSSYMWNEVKRLKLRTNMRVNTTCDTSLQLFADNLLKLGNGQFISDNLNGSISMECFGNIVKTHQELLDAVFPHLEQNFADHIWLRERAILAPTNDTVSITNNKLLKNLPAPLTIYKSVDSVCCLHEAVNYPSEFLNSLELPGIPSHTLYLKAGAPIMLLRNLDPPTLCNGTRLTVKKLHKNLIEATILTGNAAGTDVLIPRIPVIPSDLPFQFKRLQFPIRLSFAMSINKAQGQSLSVAGLDLQNPCFSHGQLYVGCSRVGNPSNMHIFIPGGRTVNIVYPEALQE